MKLMPLVSVAFLTLYFFQRAAGMKGTKSLLAARRAYPLKTAEKLIAKNLDIIKTGSQIKAPPKFLADRIIILKLPVFHSSGKAEKGAILIKFTETFEPFLDNLKSELISKYFYIILEPSWAGYAIQPILRWTTPSLGKVLISCPEEDDRTFISTLQTNLIAIEPGASDWVDDRTFYKISSSKKVYDAIYVANYNPIKRIHRYFLALSRIGIADYKAALVCSSWGKHRRRILELADYYGISEKLDIFEDLSQQELNELLNKSKVNMLLSLKEGANKSIFEGFFSGTPAIVLKDNIGVNKRYINSETGTLVHDREIEKSLLWFHESWQKFSPEIWAKNNISPLRSTEKINDILEKISREDGETWNYKIHPKTNSPELSYYENSTNKIKELVNKDFLNRLSRTGSPSTDSDENILRNFCDDWRCYLFDKAS
jgi:hypothetical protein